MNKNKKKKCLDLVTVCKIVCLRYNKLIKLCGYNGFFFLLLFFLILPHIIFLDKVDE